MFRGKVIKLAFVLNRLNSSYSAVTIKEILRKKPLETRLLIRGWVRSVRKHKNLYFVDVFDGTCFEKLQILIQDRQNNCPVYGSSIEIFGSLVKSMHEGQEVELVADTWNTLGSCPNDYPFQYKRYSPEYIRQLVHLRPRTRTFSSVLRIRNHASIAIHQFFQEEGFCFVHTPIITKNDCEGAGEVFSVQLKEKQQHNETSTKASANNNITDESDDDSLVRQVNDQQDSDEFFSDPAFLTVSGQLHLEAMACALSRVYNFGPVFRAENSRTRQHASEFHMIEAELAFIDTVDELLQIVEKCVKKVAKSILDNCSQEMNLLCENLKGHQEYIEKITKEPFIQMQYRDAIDILQARESLLHTPVKWGNDLAAEHKLVLLKHCQNVPVFVTTFPLSLKPFYMKADENKMAYCFDLFAPFGGEICGGGMREDNEEILKACSLCRSDSFSWYLDLRRYGSVPHGGFGIGFDRLLQSILGISNIRDIIPFPRRKYDCKC